MRGYTRAGGGGVTPPVLNNVALAGQHHGNGCWSTFRSAHLLDQARLTVQQLTEENELATVITIRQSTLHGTC
jgi:hypothetical protein